MNIPEIAKCIFCDASGELLPDWGERDRKVKHPDDHRQPLERCPLTGMIVEMHWWNRRQPTPEAADERERVYEDLATLLGRTDIQDEDGNHECRWCHDYVEAGSDEGFRHSRDCPFEAMKRAADYFAAHPPKPEPTEAPSGFVMVPRERLLYWTEYWNGNHNERAMADALDNIIPDIASYLSVAAPKPPAEWIEAAAKEIFKQRIYANNNEAFCGPDEIVTIIKQYYSAGDKT